MTTAIDQEMTDFAGGAKDAAASPKHYLKTSYKEVYAADEETLVRLLRTKTKHALAARGYDQDAQAHVSGLIETNVISCGIIANGNQLMEGDLFEYGSIRTQLEDLMATGFQVNSNEPVMIILADGDDNVSWDAVLAIQKVSRTILSENFHILPVRMYIAQYQNNTTWTSNSRSGFSLAMLNVVNTDIGGPSMIQLLDDDMASPDWERMVIHAEAWHGTELLWTHEKKPQHQQSDRTHDIGNEVLLEAPDSVHDTLSKPTFDKEQPPPALAFVQQHIEVNDDQGIAAEETVVMSEHPAMTELLLREAEREPVRHPSWNRHGDADSLIDLIRMQASTIDNAELPGGPHGTGDSIERSQ